jgi:hypothetical protein
VEVAGGDVDVQGASGSGQRDVEQPPLLLEPVLAGEGHVGGEVAVRGVDQVDGLPLEAFGGVDGAEDEVVLVELRLAGEVGARLWRVERELGGELLEAR